MEPSSTSQPEPASKTVSQQLRDEPITFGDLEDAIFEVKMALLDAPPDTPARVVVTAGLELLMDTISRKQRRRLEAEQERPGENQRDSR